MRILFLLVFVIETASAQYDLFDLATSGDGSTAYFASTLSLAQPGATSPAGAPGRIFRVGSERFQLYLERPRIQLPPIPVAGQTMQVTNHFDLSRPQISSNGKVMSVVGRRVCSGSVACVTEPVYQTTVTGLPQGTVDVTGAGNLSRNGRYLLINASGSMVNYCTHVVDLLQGSLNPPNPCPFRGTRETTTRHSVADDGTAVSSTRGALYILRGSTFSEFRAHPGSHDLAQIDAAACVVVYSLTDSITGKRSLRLFRIAGEVDTALVPPSEADSHSPHLSEDGQRVLYLSNASGLPQIHIISTAGGEPRQVSDDPSGVLSATMSDDGKVAWYFSGTARLYRVQLDTGETRQRLGRTPQLSINNPVGAGSYGIISGAGLSDAVYTAPSFPLPRNLGGVSVSADGQDSPLISVSPTKIEYQVPSSVLKPTLAVVRSTPSSPFVPRLTLSTGGLPSTARFLINMESLSHSVGGMCMRSTKTGAAWSPLPLQPFSAKSSISTEPALVA